MVLADLGAKIGAALKKLNTTQTIDEKLINEIMTEIASALLTSDVNIKYISKLRDSITNQAKAQMSNQVGGANLRRFI